MNQIIHAAVRRDVTRTEQALRTLPDGDTARAREIRTAWRNLVRELTHHHEAEDEHVWPFLQSRGVDLTLLEQMESEHVAMKQALTSVSTSLDAVVGAPSDDQRRGRGRRGRASPRGDQRPPRPRGARRRGPDGRVARRRGVQGTGQEAPPGQPRRRGQLPGLDAGRRGGAGAVGAAREHPGARHHDPHPAASHAATVARSRPSGADPPRPGGGADLPIPGDCRGCGPGLRSAHGPRQRRRAGRESSWLSTVPACSPSSPPRRSRSPSSGPSRVPRPGVVAGTGRGRPTGRRRSSSSSSTRSARRSSTRTACATCRR